MLQLLEYFEYSRFFSHFTIFFHRRKEMVFRWGSLGFIELVGYMKTLDTHLHNDVVAFSFWAEASVRETSATTSPTDAIGSESHVTDQPLINNTNHSTALTVSHDFASKEVSPFYSLSFIRGYCFCKLNVTRTFPPQLVVIHSLSMTTLL